MKKEAERRRVSAAGGPGKSGGDLLDAFLSMVACPLWGWTPELSRYPLDQGLESALDRFL